MSSEIINFYKKNSDNELSVNEIAPVSEPVIEQVESKPLDPFENFLQTLAVNIEKTKASDFSKKEEVTESTKEDPFAKFLTNVADIIKNDEKVQTDEQIKEATIGFINKLKDEPAEIEVTPVVKKQKVKTSYLPKKFNKKAVKKPAVESVATKPELPAIDLNTGLPETVSDIKEEVLPVVNSTPGNTYVKELETIDKSKKTPDKVTKPGDIKSLIEKQVREQINKLRQELGQSAMSSGGGGTVAVQYADGGTMNGDLNVTGKYLSGGRDLATIFTGGGGGSSDRLISGTEQLILNLDGSVTFPDNVIRPVEDSIITLESENTALSAFSRVALSPYAFFAYDSNSNSITFDSVDNSITLTSQDQYEWVFNDKGELIGPSNTLTVNSTLSTLGKILSGGRDLADIFLTSETDSQTLSFNVSTLELSISNGNTVSLSALSSTGIPADQLPINSIVVSNSANWNDVYTSWSNASATSVVEFNDTRFSKLSSQAYTLVDVTSSIQPIRGGNVASGLYSTVAGGFSGCATGYATFVGAGSGIRATGDYAVAVGGRINRASGNYSTIGGGFGNTASSTAATVGGGCGNTASGGYAVVAGGRSNSAPVQLATVGGGFGNTASGYISTIAGGCDNRVCSTVFNNPNNSFIGGGNTNITFGLNSVITGGCCNVICGIANSNILGGCGNLNSLRDSVIGGGVVNHTGGFAPFNITATGSISGNGTCTCLIGTGIQNCFSYPFTSGNVSVYYATANTPLSAGAFSTATIAATGTNFVIINGDYSTCTASGLSATSIYVYDRAINNAGYDNVIGGGKLNTASGCYGFIGGGLCNTASSCFGVVGGGCFNRAVGGVSFIGGGRNNCAAGVRSIVVGGDNNTSSGGYSFIGNGFNNSATGTGAVVVGGNGSNVSSGSNSFIGAGGSNTASGVQSVVVGGRSNTTSGCYSTIVGGKFNYNPLFNSSIQGGSFNHTGGFAPNNITSSVSISGNGTQTALIATGIGSCFSASNTTGAVSLMWTTSGTANQSLSSACFTTANVVTNVANCIIINGDYSTCTAAGLSACNIYVYDRCLNNTGCFNFIGGGVLNTASGCYGVVGGGFRNNNAGSTSSIVGGSCNFTHCTTYDSFIGGGINNYICTGGRNVVVGGFGNSATGYVTFIGGGRFNSTSSGAYMGIVAGCLNTATGSCSFIGAGTSNSVCSSNASVVGGGCNLITATGTGSVIGGGACNNISSAYSFVAGGSANDTKGFANTFILGTGLSASAANYTYVNNLSVQGTIYGDASNLTNNGAYTVQVSNFSALSNKKYAVYTGYQPNGLFATLPSNPNSGDIITFLDPYPSWNTSPLVVVYNGTSIGSLNQSLTANTASTSFTLIYFAGLGWQIIG